MRAALARNKRDAKALAQLAAICHRTQRSPEAVDLLKRLLRENPTSTEAQANLGVMLLSCGQHEEALRYCDKALVRLPNHPALHDNRGNALCKLGRYQEALEAHERALKLAPQFAEAHSNRGYVLVKLGRLQEAKLACETSLGLNPQSSRALYNYGDLLLRLNQTKEALQVLSRALALQPNFPEALTDVGISLSRLRQPEKALATLDSVLAQWPDYVPAIIARGMVLVDLNRVEEALSICEHLSNVTGHEVQRLRAAALVGLNDPASALQAIAEDSQGDQPLLLLKAYAQHKLGRWAVALELYRAAFEIDPENQICRWHLSNAELTNGNLQRGFELYESRWEGTDLRPPIAEAAWLGTPPLAGKRLLIHCEQGYGDTIQFVRYAPLLAADGVQVVLRVQPQLKSLMERLEGISDVFDTDAPIPNHHAYCPVASLPLAKGTDLGNIPANVPYLYPVAERVAEWQQRLAAMDNLPRIGLVVSGNPSHRNDANRSMPLSQLEHLLTLPALFVLVQQAVADRDKETVASHPGVFVVGDELKTFEDTAALLQNLDLLISVDTSVAHLAGALGKPVWLMLPFVPDWRWLLDRDDSPWYPTARLFRQPKAGDWTSVIAAITDALQAKFSFA